MLLWAPSSGWVPAIVSGLMVLPVRSKGQRQQGSGPDRPPTLEAARAYRWTGQDLSAGYLPSVLPPYFASGCATALAWKAGWAEVLCLPKLAIGTRLYRAKITMDTPTCLPGRRSMLSFLLEYVLGFLRRLEGVKRDIRKRYYRSF